MRRADNLTIRSLHVLKTCGPVQVCIGIDFGNRTSVFLPEASYLFRLTTSVSCEIGNIHKISVGISQWNSGSKRKPGVEWKIMYWEDLRLRLCINSPVLDTAALGGV